MPIISLNRGLQLAMAKHVVISGTGRAGTTFLVELLTHLGFDTGFCIDSIEKNRSPVSFGGLEFDIRAKGCPYIVKSPWLCEHIDEVCARSDIIIEHLFVPVRNLQEAADSRRLSSSMGEPNGGLWDVDSPAEGLQEQVLLKKFYILLYFASTKQFPVTLLQFPDLASDALYLYEKLQPVLSKKNISVSEFSNFFYEIAKPERIHDFSRCG
jgi:hypothetical protein